MNEIMKSQNLGYHFKGKNAEKICICTGISILLLFFAKVLINSRGHQSKLDIKFDKILWLSLPHFCFQHSNNLSLSNTRWEWFILTNSLMACFQEHPSRATEFEVTSSYRILLVFKKKKFMCFCRAIRIYLKKCI